MGRDALVEKLDKLLDDAIWEGRANWDGYYGHDNSYHMLTIKDSAEYKELYEILHSR